jgi:hypothetical protein
MQHGADCVTDTGVRGLNRRRAGLELGSVTPITFTVESIIVATRSAQRRPQILYIVAFSAIPSIVLGLRGLYSAFVNWISPAVIGGVIAGVGIILAGVGVDYLRESIPAHQPPAGVHWRAGESSRRSRW